MRQMFSLTAVNVTLLVFAIALVTVALVLHNSYLRGLEQKHQEDNRILHEEILRQKKEIDKLESLLEIGNKRLEEQTLLIESQTAQIGKLVLSSRQAIQQLVKDLPKIILTNSAGQQLACSEREIKIQVHKELEDMWEEVNGK